MVKNDVTVVPDSEGEDVPEEAETDIDSDVMIIEELNNSNSEPQGSSGPLCGPSPIQQQQTLGREGASAAVRQLLYQTDDDVCEDVAATEAHKLRQQLTGKAPIVEKRVKREVSTAVNPQQPTQGDIDDLEAQLQDDPTLLARLMNGGEGSSSNPRHIWRLVVFQAYLKQQEELLSQAQQSQQHSGQDDTEAAGADAEPAAKRRRTMSHEAASGSGAGSSREQRRMRQQQRQQQADSEPAAAAAADRLDQPDWEQQQQEEDEQQQQQPPQVMRSVRQAVAAAEQKPRVQQQQRRQRAQPLQQARPQATPAAAAAAPDAPAAAGPSRQRAPRGPLSMKEKQRNLRRKLSMVEADAARRRDRLLDSNQDELVSVLTDLEYLSHLIERPREAAQEAGVLSVVLRDGVDMINAFNSATRGRTPEQLTRTLKLLFAADPLGPTSDAPTDINWLQLGAEASHLFRAVPGVSSMLGGLASEAKARAKVVRQKQQAPEPEERPVVGSAALAQEHGLGQETERVVTEMRRQLERVGSCTALQLVLDHDSFAHTLENVFALSFLCKDMYVRLELDKEEGMMVHNITKQERALLINEHAAKGPAGGQQAAAGAARLTPHQFIMELDMAGWRDMCAVVPRRHTLMPARSTRPH